MPAVLIETRRPQAATDEQAMMDAVHRALIEAFKIPANDKNIRLVSHEPHRFVCPPSMTRPELFTFVTIDAFAGRSLEAKRELYQQVASNLKALGIPKDHVTVLLREAPTENWGVRGGRAACDIDLGFKIDI